MQLRHGLCRQGHSHFSLQQNNNNIIFAYVQIIIKDIQATLLGVATLNMYLRLLDVRGTPLLVSLSSLELSLLLHLNRDDHGDPSYV